MPTSLLRFLILLLAVVATAADAAPRIWFVNNAASAGDGSIAAPFDTLAAAQAAAAPGDVLFVFSGRGAYRERVVLREGQALIGETFAFASILAARGLDAPQITAGTLPPQIDVPDGDALTLANDSGAYGLSVASAAGRALVLPELHGNVALEQTTLTTVGGVAVSIDGGDANVTFDASPIRAASGAALEIKRVPSGSIVMRNGSTVTVTEGTRGAVSLTENGARIELLDALALSTSAASALTISACRNVTMSSPASTLQSRSAAALEVTGSAVALTFERVSAEGGTRGVVIENATGSVRVTGREAVAGSGGTIRNASELGVSITGDAQVSLRNMTLQSNAGSKTHAAAKCTRITSDDDPHCSAAVHLTGATAELENVVIDATRQVAIHGNRVKKLTLTNVTITGSGDEAGEGAIQLRKLAGALVMKSSAIRGSASRHLHVTATEGDSSVEIRATEFASTGTAHGQQGVLVDAGGKARVAVTIDGAAFEQHGSHALHVVAAGEANITADISRSRFDDQQSGILLVGSRAGAMRFRITDNSVTRAKSHAIAVSADLSGGSMSGTISGNVIGTAGQARSGASCGGCAAISLSAGRAGSMTAEISGNTLQQADGGVLVAATGNTDARVTVKRNTIREPFGPAPMNAILFEAGAEEKDAVRLCADVSDNTISGAWDAQGEKAAIAVRANTAATKVSLGGFEGNGDAGKLLSTRNRGASVSAMSFDGSTAAFQGARSCAAK